MKNSNFVDIGKYAVSLAAFLVVACGVATGLTGNIPGLSSKIELTDAFVDETLAVETNGDGVTFVNIYMPFTGDRDDVAARVVKIQGGNQSQNGAGPIPSTTYDGSLVFRVEVDVTQSGVVPFSVVAIDSDLRQSNILESSLQVQ